MHYNRVCPICSKKFTALNHKATYCNELCKKKAAYRRLRDDPVYLAKKKARRRPRTDRKMVGADEAHLIMACKDAGWTGPQTSDLIQELFGWARSSKVIQAVWRRCREWEKNEEIFRVAASERIPDYRADNDAFLAAVRAAPECPPEGIIKDERPLVAAKFSRALGSLGGSPAGEMASFGD